MGRFITLEGGEGTGKSTLLRGLADALRAQGRDVVLTREPGGAPGADAIRALLVSGDAARWSAMEEALLFAAARLNHLNADDPPGAGARRLGDVRSLLQFNTRLSGRRRRPGRPARSMR